MKNPIHLFMWGAALCLAFGQAQAETLTLKPEIEALDLDTGAVTDSMSVAAIAAPSGADIRISWHADRVPHAVVTTTGKDVSVGYSNNAYAYVTAMDIGTVSFTSQAEDRAFDGQITVLIHTQDGSVYKLGNPVETDDAISFDYEKLQ